MKIKLRELKIKARINKCNGQINFALPKRKVTKELIAKAETNKPIKFFFEDE